MKFVFMKQEVAQALQLSVSEFENARSKLEQQGFPGPIDGLHERWSIMDVINWVNRSSRPKQEYREVLHRQPSTVN